MNCSVFETISDAPGWYALLESKSRTFLKSCVTPLLDDMFVSSHLKMKKYFIFSRFNRIFALSLHKICFGLS